MNKTELFLLVVTDGDKDSEERTQQPRDTVQVMDTTDILDAQLVVEERGELFVSENRADTSNPSTSQSSRGSDFEVSDHTHDDTTSQGGVLNVDGFELVGQQTREQERGDGTRAERQKGVDDGIQPLSSGEGKSSVERRPHNPEEKCSKEREDIGAVARGVVLMTLGVTVGQEPGDSQTEVGTEKMNNHTTTNIDGSDLTREDSAVDVDPEEHRLHETHHEKLGGGNLTQDGTIGNQNSGRSEERVQQLGHGNITVVVDGKLKTVFLGLSETVQNDGPLRDNSTDEEGVSNSTESTSSQKSHKETETNKNHNVDISVEKKKS